MPEIRYGTSRDPKWVAMVTPACVLVVAAGLPRDRSVDIWNSISSATTVQPVLDALTRGGISTTPDFFLAATGSADSSAPFALSLIVRGPLGVRLRTSSGESEISGEGVSTWVERVVPDAVYAWFGAGALASDSGTAAEFVLNHGSAPVDWLSLGTAGEAPIEQPARVPRPAAAVPPAPRAPERPSVPDPEATISDATVSASQGDDEVKGGYDFLFGETVVRTVEGAAVREDVEPVAGDHDGKTAVGLSAAERRAARAARQGRSAPQVPAVPAFVLTFSTGQREALDQGLIIGRAPSASKVSASSVPRLMTVGGPDQDISRNHVQVTVEGGTVMVTDLHSRNGTIVTLPGRPPQQLRGGQPTAVLTGAMIDLGSGISFTVEDA